MTGLFYSLPLSSNWLQTETGDDQSDVKQSLQSLYDDKSPLVLYGAENCGKTLLLFQAAVAYASQDYHVTYISRSPLSKMPLPVHGTIRPETAGQLQTLTFLYMSKATDLISHCSAVHMKPVLPDIIIVDDLDFYISQLMEPNAEAGCAKLCAILQDTKSFIQSKGGLGVLMMGCRNSQSYTRHVFPQFNFAMANITAQNLEKKQFLLSLKKTSRKISVTLTYSIEEIGLYVRDLNLVTSKEKLDLA